MLPIIRDAENGITEADLLKKMRASLSNAKVLKGSKVLGGSYVNTILHTLIKNKTLYRQQFAYPQTGRLVYHYFCRDQKSEQIKINFVSVSPYLVPGLINKGETRWSPTIPIAR